MTLLEKLRRSREFKVPVNGHNFTARRPTALEALSLSESSIADLAVKFVIGWDLRELDVIAGGGPEPAPFDAETWAAWVADKPKLWTPIGQAVLDAFTSHQAAQGAAEKN